MHLKRFRARTAADALEAARQALGPQALVLATRAVSRGGWRCFLGAEEFEVTAAAEREVSEDRRPRQERRHQPRPAAGVLHAQLCAAGFDRALVDEIAGMAAARAAAAPEGDALRVATADDVRRALAAWSGAITATGEDQVSIDVFVGPPGGGKTTVTLQLAAGYVADGRRPVLVSTDPTRLGALEPLRLQAHLMGVPFITARTLSQLALALSDRRGPVLVDTVGCPANDAASREVLSLIATTPRVRAHLVVPAGTSPSALERLAETFRVLSPRHVILTKIEDGGPAAPLAATLRARELRVSYLAAGCRGPRDLHRATPALVAAALVGDSLTASEHAA
jgi:flagellar biosynthesis protein FlhF